MAHKVIKPTEAELKQKIYEAVLPMLNEIDAVTYAMVHNATYRAKMNNQQGQY